MVEVGWRGMRELSLFLRERGFSIWTLIKGCVSREIMDVITRYPEINLIWIRRKLFRLLALWVILKGKFFGDLRCVVVSKERTRRWVGWVGRLLKFETLLLLEEDEGYRLIASDGVKVDKEWLIGNL